MEAYFIRHTKGMTVVDEAIDCLWERNKIAIHFEDKESLDDRDYKIPAAKKAVRIFRELRDNGGYVWAEYRNRKDIKVGKIAPTRHHGVCKTKWVSSEKTAILKTLQIDEKSVRMITPTEAMAFRAARPPAVTISRWPSKKDSLKSLVEREHLKESWDNLGTERQETVCAEYLRNPDAPECPVLEHLLMPVGRTLEHVDIYGYSTDKKMLFAQVTYSKKEDSGKKIQNLKAYGSPHSHLVFFCNCERIEVEDGILFIPWRRVENWLKNYKAYLHKLFADVNKRRTF